MIRINEAFETKETLLLGVEDYPERHFGRVEAFAEEIDGDQPYSRSGPPSWALSLGGHRRECGPA